MGFTETDNQDEESRQTPDKEPPNSSEGMNNFSEPEEEPEITESKSSVLCFIKISAYNCQNVYE